MLEPGLQKRNQQKNAASAWSSLTLKRHVKQLYFNQFITN